MDRPLLDAVIVCIIFAVIFGPLTARSTLRREPVHGGRLPMIFNLIGASALVAVLPGVIAALVLGGGFRLAFPLALTCVFISITALVIFASLEYPARSRFEADQQRKAQQGWTEEDARRSGL
jgi:hypothetical protein